MPASWESFLQRWVDAGLIDDASAAHIRQFEARSGPSQRLRWPILLALALGGALLGAGMLLFVSAHWDQLSPAARFATVLLLVGVFHIGAALAADRLPPLATTLHGVGTVAFGAGIMLTGAVFNLQEHWPSGILLWMLGAWAGWVLLRNWVQAVLAALLTPAWLAAEWIVATQDFEHSERLLEEGLLLLAFAYFTARTAQNSSPFRDALMWTGGLVLFPIVMVLVLGNWHVNISSTVPAGLAILGWSAALLLPMLVAFACRGRAAWMNLLTIPWVVVLGALSKDLPIYFWCVLGSIGLVAWGLAESRPERVNVGVAGFAVTVLIFYFSNVMDKLGRSMSLIGLGALFLGGGWLLERTRRRLVARMNRAT